MATTESRGPDEPPRTTADEHSPNGDVTRRRRELARLIGRLLAKHWLRQQQRDDRHWPIDSQGNAPSRDT